MTVHEVLATTFWYTRIVAGLTLLVAWPIVLRLCLALFPPSGFLTQNVTSTGVLLAALAYVLSWAPIAWLPHSAVLLAIISLFLITVRVRPGILCSLGIWFCQGLFVLLIMGALFVAIHGMNPIREGLAIVRYASTHDTGDNPGIYHAPAATIPVELTIRWDSSGSPWLDKQSGNITFEIRSEVTSPPMAVEFKDEAHTRFYKDLTSVPFRFRQSIIAGRPYQLLVTGNEGVSTSVVVYGVLPARFGA
jgi:hypothetical protein